ncbi:hypothetical protein [Mangrovicoccus sp. HB161399]|uniref:hypothetical protein n=1 Tax=Mangrovicoccus sp. HB161399 TaxID=2720392 RepID=UPI0020A62028|nr:hypothetical protein [Mangrovicoccus sp. HB161399]
MADPLTITIPEAAKRLGAPKAVVERVAADLGLLIVFGKRKKIDPNDLPEIMNACRSKPRALASTAGKIPASTSSATPAAGSAQQALATAERLKRLSPATSKNATAPVVPLRQTK